MHPRGYHHGNLKEALVDAARGFIAERGIAGFTLADAAKFAGVSPAALYRHFRGREDLLSEVARRGFGLFAERLAGAFLGPGDPVARFTRVGEAYLAFAEQEPGYYAAMFSMRPDLDERGHQRWTEAERSFELLVETLQKSFPDGFGPVPPRFLAAEIWALSHGIATLSAAAHLPRGPGAPDKYELLRAGVLAIVSGARAGLSTKATPA
jgi:AcrR family transcriptional regulator